MPGILAKNHELMAEQSRNSPDPSHDSQTWRARSSVGTIALVLKLIQSWGGFG